jgi:hypothetical protein
MLTTKQIFSLGSKLSTSNSEMVELVSKTSWLSWQTGAFLHVYRGCSGFSPMVIVTGIPKQQESKLRVPSNYPYRDFIWPSQWLDSRRLLPLNLPFLNTLPFLRPESTPLALKTVTSILVSILIKLVPTVPSSHLRPSHQSSFSTRSLAQLQQHNYNMKFWEFFQYLWSLGGTWHFQVWHIWRSGSTGGWEGTQHFYWVQGVIQKDFLL